MEMKQEGPGWMGIFYFGWQRTLVRGLQKEMKHHADIGEIS